MKLRVVIDEQGNILAAAVLETAKARLLPVAQEEKGHKAVDLSVPPEFAHLDLLGIVQCLRVDTEEKCPTLRAKK